MRIFHHETELFLSFRVKNGEKITPFGVQIENFFVQNSDKIIVLLLSFFKNKFKRARESYLLSFWHILFLKDENDADGCSMADGVGSAAWLEWLWWRWKQ